MKVKQKGFTLIELLAVIIVLSIILTIASPIVLSTIKNSRRSTEVDSAKLYLKAVQQSILRNNMEEGINYKPAKCKVLENGDLLCDETATIKVEAAGRKPSTGIIDFENGEITDAIIKIGKRKIMKTGAKQFEYVKTINEICKLLSGESLKKGSKYECKVDPDRPPYNFFVLETPSEDSMTIDLIMDSNIRKNGDPVKEENPTEEQKGAVAWISNDKFLEFGGTQAEWNAAMPRYTKGPITAMEYLVEATSKWTNLLPVTIGSFNDQDGEVAGVIKMPKTFETYARLPEVGELVSVNSLRDVNGKKTTSPASSENIFLYEYLGDGCVWGSNSGLRPESSKVTRISGYWTSSRNTLGRPSDGIVETYEVWVVNYCGFVATNIASTNNGFGVRPVISVQL